MALTADTARDNCGVPITEGDRVMVTAIGYGATGTDVRLQGTVVGYARTRVCVDFGGRAPRHFGPAVLSVLAPEGSGYFFEHNRRRAAAADTAN